LRTEVRRAGAGHAVGRFVGTVGLNLAELLKSLKSLGRPEELSIVYEARPCGCGLVRELRARGYVCEVIAPSKIPRRAGDRVKTDRRDAVRLAGLARACELVRRSANCADSGRRARVVSGTRCPQMASTH